VLALAETAFRFRRQAAPFAENCTTSPHHCASNSGEDPPEFGMVKVKD